MALTINSPCLNANERAYFWNPTFINILILLSDLLKLSTKLNYPLPRCQNAGSQVHQMLWQALTTVSGIISSELIHLNWLPSKQLHGSNTIFSLAHSEVLFIPTTYRVILMASR